MSDETSEFTHDAFLNDRFRLWQPRGGALRAGHDALLVAAALPEMATGAAVDMGAGTGAVGFVAATRAPRLRVVLAEREPSLTQLLRRSIEETSDPLRMRLGVAEVDLLATRSLREAAGLHDGAFDWVLTNPPFHPTEGRVSPDPVRAAALTMPAPDFLARWVAVAATFLRHGGYLIAVGRPENLPTLFSAAENRLGSVAVLPIHTGDKPAHRILLTAVRGSRAPLRILPSFRLDEEARRRLSAGEGLPVRLVP
ncbi:tRNA1(Val) (adenine(37)-N6)-methyltransferase [Aureimonas sp. AU4]|uniref:tRNA1(Val) (adenine(37)-N6)-methyltransferase n=1 Tax=Aureimonas sp. AU4 TaxID=1638163 RepID=UPI0007825EAD|nr:methyltransferase [Aureimonas sp. AU4]